MRNDNSCCKLTGDDPWAPAAASDGQSALRVEITWVKVELARIRSVMRRAKFPHVAQHVVKPEGVGPITADRRTESVTVVHWHCFPGPMGMGSLQRAVADVDDLAGSVLLASPPKP